MPQKAGLDPVSPEELLESGDAVGDDEEGRQLNSGREAEEIVCGGESDGDREEAQVPKVLRDPGAPSQKEIETHNVTHLPYRSWCPSCVAGKARDRGHHRQQGPMEKQVPEVVFDYCFMNCEGEEESVAIQVARDRRTRAVFAHVVPRKGMTHEYGAKIMVSDLGRLGYHEIILKCDGEPALRSVQEEVKHRREAPTILENSPVGDSRANGAAERAIQAVEEQVRVIKNGLETRIGMKISGKHPVTFWLIEHAADLLTKYAVGEDGKTAYERMKGKPYLGDVVEFGEKIHHRLRKKGDKMDVRWDEGFYLGKMWRTGEAIVGTEKGIRKAASIKRVGGHRRWDGEGLNKVQGVPWRWDPDEEDMPKELRVRYLTDEEKMNSGISPETSKIYRMRLKKEDFLQYGFTEGCPGCSAILGGRVARGHTEECRTRMIRKLGEDDSGKKRVEKQVEKENEHLEKELERRCGEEDEQRRKNARKMEPDVRPLHVEGEVRPEMRSVHVGGDGGSGLKRAPEGDCVDRGEERRRKMRMDHEHNEKRKQEEETGGKGDEKRAKKETDVMENQEGDMEVTHMEKMMQDDMPWMIGEVSDMCENQDPDLVRMEVGMEYYDENTWEPLDTKLVAMGEKDEMERFKKMGVYTYASRAEAESDENGKFVKVKWVRINKGTKDKPKVRCRLVAQELGYGERLDELFAGTPSLPTVRLAILHAARGGGQYCLMVMDVKCAFLYGDMKRSVYIELPVQDEKSGDGRLVGKLMKAMYGTRDAPQIWTETVQAAMEKIGMSASILQPSVYYHRQRCLLVVVHVDDFLCAGPQAELEWLYGGLRAQFEVSKVILGPDGVGETTYLNRVIRWEEGLYSIEGDPKHYRTLVQEWGMESCKPVISPMTKEGKEKAGEGDVLAHRDATRVRRAIARVNYMAQDRADLSSVARVASQHMSEPRTGTELLMKRVIRYLKSQPRVMNVINPLMLHGQEMTIEAITDSDWAGDVDNRKSCSGGVVMVNGCLLSHWSKVQQNVALSSGEAEMNGSVKAISECLGIQEMIREIYGETAQINLRTDSSACKGMMLRKGCGRVKHLSVKQLWVQGAIKNYGITVEKIPREQNFADALTHEVNREFMQYAMKMMGYKDTFEADTE